MFAVLPDTQVYALRYPGIFDSQTAWVARNADALNIRYAFHLGDIVNNNTDREWRHAADAMALLDDLVPVALVPGNHDYQHWGWSMNRVTSLNSWFTADEQRAMPGFAGAYQPGRGENTYHLFSAAGHEWIALALEWGPRDEVVAWADQVMLEHDDRLGILVRLELEQVVVALAALTAAVAGRAAPIMGDDDDAVAPGRKRKGH